MGNNSNEIIWVFPDSTVRPPLRMVYNYKTDKYTDPFYPSGGLMKKTRFKTKPRKSLADEIIDLDRTIKKSKKTQKKGAHQYAFELLRARKHAGLTVSEVAIAMGRLEPQIYKLESGSHLPTLRTIEKYAKAVRCKVIVVLTPISKKGMKKNGKK